jgi:hypothetical protein
VTPEVFTPPLTWSQQARAAAEPDPAHAAGEVSTVAEWNLTVREGKGGRLEIDGLPADRAERLSVVMRLLDTLAVVRTRDDIRNEGAGVLWQRYAKAAYTRGWLPEAKVRLVTDEITLLDDGRILERDEP